MILLAKAIRRELADDDDRELTKTLSFIVDAAADSGEYASMVRSLLGHVAPWQEDWALRETTLLEALRADAARGHVFRIAGP